MRNIPVCHRQLLIYQLLRLHINLQDIAHKIGSPQVPPVHPRSIAGEDVEIARHFVQHDAQLAVVHDPPEGPGIRW